MRNFLRALKLTFKYKWNIVGIFISSLLLALCWGGNIATVYPLVQVSFQGETIRGWLDKEITDQNERIQKFSGELQQLLGIEDAFNLSVKERNELLKNVANSDRNRCSTIINQIEASQKLRNHYLLIKPYVDEWTPDSPFLTVVLLMFFVLGTTIIKSVCTFIHSFLSSRIGQLGAFELRALFFRKMLAYEVNFFTQKGVADATSRFTFDMGALSNGLTLTYGKALREPLKMIVCIVGAAIVSWQLLLFTFLFVPVAAVLIRWLAKSLKRVVRRAMVQMAQLYGRIDETFHAIRVVKSFNREGYEIAKFRVANKTFFQRSMKTAKYDAITSPLTECLGIGMLVLAVMAGAYLIIYEKTQLFGIPTSSRPLDLGALILFYGFLIGASDPARRLSDIFTNVQTACAAADRIYEIIDREPLIKDTSSPKRLARFQKSIVFENVFYEYPQELSLSLSNKERSRARFEDVVKKWIATMFAKIVKTASSEAIKKDVAENGDSNESSASKFLEATRIRENRFVLKNVSLEIKFGETIAIVGRSGCGKSTLTSMIPRFIDPISGRVLLDGVPLQELRISDVRDQIGLVSQDSVLFNDTIFENIRYGRPGATQEEVFQAAKDAYADGFIREELSDGYDTIVGPGGGALSGGQRQRIALARALLKNPKIFLLDEATSQIDLQSERYIHQALKNFIGGRTTIMVTHRLGAIELADRVVVMQDGAVQFVGTHDEALKNSTFYAALWTSEEFDGE